ncbi:MAG TPA: tetratricopeptide repeat protein [Leptolyngbyaceae cyanobacterium]
MLGQILRGRYQIIRLLGSGGFGDTYLAIDRDLPGSPQCVVKQLKSKNVQSSVWQTARRLFETEAQVLYRLGKHDRIPQLLAHFEENQEFYLVQEFIEGEDLSQELIPGKQLNEAEVIALLEDILTILGFVHQQNVIHRDIKPSNLIRRQQDGKFVLIDFGAVKEISTLVGNTQEQIGGTVLIGSSGYMPSEQLGGKPRFNSDIYALGMTAIQALTGTFPDELPEISETGEVDWREYARVSNRLAAILNKMVRSHFRDRYQSATEVLADLVKLKMATGSFTQRFVLLGGNQKPFVRYYPLIIIVISIFITFGISKLLAFLPSNEPPSIAISKPTLYPHIPAAVESLNQGKTLVELRRYEEAIITLERAVQIDPKYPEAWLERGKALEKLQKYEDALRSYDEALKLQSDYSEAWYNRSVVLSELKRYDDALISLNKAIEKQPKYPEAYYFKGVLLDKLQRDEEALSSLNKSIEINPDYGLAWYYRGLILNNLERYQEALESLEKAIQIEPSSVEIWVEKASTLDKLNQYEEAIRCLQQALEIKPDYAEAWQERGNVLSKLKRYEEALASLDKAVQIKPDYAEAWYIRGMVLEKIQKYDLAIQSLDKATQIKPDYWESWYRRGVILEKMEKLEEAVGAYGKAIEIWPAHREAIENRKRLLNKLGR